MPVNTVAENVLGTIGAICWTVQLVPQIWKSWRTKSTEGLSDWFILMWSIGAVFLGVYAVVQDINVPLILQPQLFSALSLFSWAQCMYYGRKSSFKTCTISFISLAATFGGFEAGMVYAVRPSYRRGDQGPVEAFGILSSAIISLALLYTLLSYLTLPAISPIPQAPILRNLQAPRGHRDLRHVHDGGHARRRLQRPLARVQAEIRRHRRRDVLARCGTGRHRNRPSPHTESAGREASQTRRPCAYRDGRARGGIPSRGGPDCRRIPQFARFARGQRSGRYFGGSQYTARAAQGRRRTRGETPRLACYAS